MTGIAAFLSVFNTTIVVALVLLAVFSVFRRLRGAFFAPRATIYPSRRLPPPPKCAPSPRPQPRLIAHRAEPVDHALLDAHRLPASLLGWPAHIYRMPLSTYHKCTRRPAAWGAARRPTGRWPRRRGHGRVGVPPHAAHGHPLLLRLWLPR
jgi:hypothetical protein